MCEDKKKNTLLNSWVADRGCQLVEWRIQIRHRSCQPQLRIKGIRFSMANVIYLTGLYFIQGFFRWTSLTGLYFIQGFFRWTLLSCKSFMYGLVTLVHMISWLYFTSDMTMRHNKLEHQKRKPWIRNRTKIMETAEMVRCYTESNVNIFFTRIMKDKRSVRNGAKK